jgi:hypothetical protein
MTAARDVLGIVHYVWQAPEPYARRAGQVRCGPLFFFLESGSMDESHWKAWADTMNRTTNEISCMACITKTTRR